MFTYIFLIVGCVLCVDAVSFINPCSLEDGACLTKSATATLKNILTGKKEIKTPHLNPLVLPKVELNGAQLKLILNDLHVVGLEDSYLKSVKFSTKERKGEATLHVPKAELLGDYIGKGKILILTLDAHDKCNITAVDGDYTWSFTYDLVQKGGKPHLKITSDSTKYVMKRAYFQFNNIITGNEELSLSTNELLNKEWEAVLEDLGQGISATIGSVFKLVTDNIFTKYPLTEITKQ